MRKVAVFLLILILIGSVSCSAFFNRKVVTTKIYDEKIKTTLLSPDKEILLIVNDSDELVLYNLKTDEVITKYELVTSEYFSGSHAIRWGLDNKIYFTRNFLDSNGEYVGSKQYETENFVEFKKIHEYIETQEWWCSL
ncbi:MAG TPA: hypothetical protein GXX70_09295 [Tepidimicrobium sp.]|nr:hypothetical protein [Tepidimicrobium sp.]